MPGWTIIVIGAFIALFAVVAIGALRERRRGQRGAPDPEYTQSRAEEDMRMHNRGQQGYLGGM